MAKDQNQRRQQKAARRRRRGQQASRSSALAGQDELIDFSGQAFQPGGIFGGGFRSLENLEDDDFDMSPPPEGLMDSSRCPVNGECEGCGSQEGLHAVVSLFGGSPGKWDAACATLCPDCDGESSLALLGVEGTQEAVRRHSSHAA